MTMMTIIIVMLSSLGIDFNVIDMLESDDDDDNDDAERR